MVKLEARLVDHFCAQHVSCGDLHRVICVQAVVPASNKAQITDTLILNVVASEAVAEHQGIVLAQLIIDARADAQPVLRGFENAIERGDGKGVRIYGNGVDDIAVVDVAIEHIQKEGRALTNRAAYGPAEFAQQKWSFLGGIRVA